MSNKKFIMVRNLSIIRKLKNIGIECCCSNDDGEAYYFNTEEVLSQFTEEQKRGLIYTDMLLG